MLVKMVKYTGFNVYRRPYQVLTMAPRKRGFLELRVEPKQYNKIEKTKMRLRRSKVRRDVLRPPAGQRPEQKGRGGGGETNTFVLNDQGVKDHGLTVNDEGPTTDDHAFASRSKHTGLSFSSAHEG